MDDKTRWNEKHKSPLMPTDPSIFLQKYINENGKGKVALDIACGTGRHTHYLSNLHYEVDAVDISDYGLSQIRKSHNINLIEADLTTYQITPNRYDLILNINYLERSLFPTMLLGLKENGILIFETFLDAHDKAYAQPSNPDYLLQPNELLNVFKNLEVLEYQEYDSINIHGEKVKIASFAGKK